MDPKPNLWRGRAEAISEAVGPLRALPNRLEDEDILRLATLGLMAVGLAHELGDVLPSAAMPGYATAPFPPPGRVDPDDHEAPLFQPGDHVRVFGRRPIGCYRAPFYLRGKIGRIEAIVEPCGLSNEEEGFGGAAEGRAHCYRIAVPMAELWPGYEGSPCDGLYVDVLETWLERA